MIGYMILLNVKKPNTHTHTNSLFKQKCFMRHKTVTFDSLNSFTPLTFFEGVTSFMDRTVHITNIVLLTNLPQNKIKNKYWNFGRCFFSSTLNSPLLASLQLVGLPSSQNQHVRHGHEHIHKHYKSTTWHRILSGQSWGSAGLSLMYIICHVHHPPSSITCIMFVITLVARISL